MGTLASELGPHVDRTHEEPRVYVDANVPAGRVGYMRQTLHWDVLFVVEHDDLRRARDDEHYRLAKQLRRTLITLDRDYLDDRRFPMEESGGVIVMMAPGQGGYLHLLKRLDQELFRVQRFERLERSERLERLPLEGKKLHVHIDWPGMLEANA
jgi:hypothetical protein